MADKDSGIALEERQKEGWFPHSREELLCKCERGRTVKSGVKRGSFSVAYAVLRHLGLSAMLLQVETPLSRPGLVG